MGIVIPLLVADSSRQTNKLISECRGRRSEQGEKCMWKGEGGKAGKQEVVGVMRGRPIEEGK